LKKDYYADIFDKLEDADLVARIKSNREIKMLFDVLKSQSDRAKIELLNANPSNIEEVVRLQVIAKVYAGITCFLDGIALEGERAFEEAKYRRLLDFSFPETLNQDSSNRR